jgi:hypothetical protein
MGGRNFEESDRGMFHGSITSLACLERLGTITKITSECKSTSLLLHQPTGYHRGQANKNLKWHSLFRTVNLNLTIRSEYLEMNADL